MLITSFNRVVILRINIYSGFDGIVVVLMRLLCKWKIEQYYYCSQISNDVRAFDWHIYQLDIDPLQRSGQDRGHSQFNCEYLQNGGGCCAHYCCHRM